MHRTEDGTIQVTRKFALGVAAVVIGLALAAMFLIGMIAGGNGGGGPRAEMDPTPSVLAAEDETETPTAVVQIAKQDVETETSVRPQTGSKTEYSTCLIRSQKSILLDTGDARFTPWANYGDNRSVWDVISYRYLDYISDHCQEIAPAPPSTYSSTCIPRELQSFYRRHIPEGSDNDSLRAIAGEYALTICQPSAD